LVRIHFQNTSKVVADELVRQVSSLPGTTVTSVSRTGVAYKLGPDGIPWVNIFISVKPYAYAAGLYVTTKFTDLLFELAKDWLTSRKTKPSRRVYILGPNGEVVGCVQIKGNETEDVTEQLTGRTVKVPFEDCRK
jgi:hypothetical protein